MIARSSVRWTILIGVAMLAAMAADAGSASVSAQGRLDARYSASLAGIPIGRGAWLIDINASQYRAAASGATAGLMRVFASGHGTSAAFGTISRGQPVTSTYASSIVTDKKTDQVRMVLSAGLVREYLADPPTPPSSDRVPLTEAHRRGVSDPMTASLMRVPGNGNTLMPEACHRKISIFDGRLRYDLQFAFKRMDKVKSEKGYQGTVVVCAVYFLPIAGHVPDRAAIKYLVQLRNMEVWLAPVAGTRLMVPYRMSIPTPLGLGVLQATQFVSVPQLPQPTATSITTQGR